MKRITNMIAKNILSHYSDKERISRFILGRKKVDPIVFLPATENMKKRLLKTLGFKNKQNQVTRISLGTHKVSICCSGVGAPSTEIIVNALIAGGAKYIIRVDVCGGLLSDQQIGNIFLAENAYSLDGVSSLYSPKVLHSASSALINSFHKAVNQQNCNALKFTKGTIVTVDYFFAQRLEHHQKWQTIGSAVDMESAALYAICNSLGAKTMSAMVISDVKIADLDPFLNLPFDFVALQNGLKSLFHLIPSLVDEISLILPN